MRKAIQQAEELAPVVAAYCRRPAVRHELGLEETTDCTATLLAASDRNLHYLVQTADERHWLARLATGSAFGLSSAKQTAYTARAQRLIEAARLGPHVCYVDATLYHLPYGLIVMEYLPGTPLDYDDSAQMAGAARLLANLHRQPVPADHALRIEPKPLERQLETVGELLFRASVRAEPSVINLAHHVITTLRARLARLPTEPQTLVHGTPLARNWRVAATPAPLIIGGLSLPSVAPRNLRLIDWATAQISDSIIDLCALLAEAHSHWASNLTQATEQREEFLRTYLAARPGTNETALRSRMALYQPLADLELLLGWTINQDAISARRAEALIERIGASM